LDEPVTSLPRVGVVEARRLEKLGIRTLRDLLLQLPYEWDTFGAPVPVSALRPDQPAAVVGVVESIAARKTPRRSMKLAEAMLRDDQGGRLKVVWFNQPFLATQIRAGTRLAVWGTVRVGRYGGFEMQNPERGRARDLDATRASGLVPKYHLTEGLSSRRLADWVGHALPLADQLEDVIPDDVRRRHRLPPIAVAVRRGHRPANLDEWREARRRMAFAEIFELQVAFADLRRRQAVERTRRIPFQLPVIEAFKAGLPFSLTGAQRRSAWEIFQDLAREPPMNRLLNGDVGAGKTAVAAAAVAMAHAAGRQSMVMAPTEILARQHLHKFRSYLEGTFPGLTVELLVSGLAVAERRRVRAAAASGHCALLVGTHALIEDDVELPELGLAVVDEQHRFGTRQRELLRMRGRERPHFLAMTATPIPRSLALALYGEMALSFLDEMPPGRTRVSTRIVRPEERERAYELVRRELRAGRQAFVICPLVEESESAGAVKAATVEFERLRTDVFPGFRMSLVHGRLREKDAVMSAFATGETQLLVATAVVEVGVDVPNATVMLIEGAERFGLAQLHQFRGRVGRGEHASHCLLFAESTEAPYHRRLELLMSVNDGFRLAEEDMRMRGMGQLMGSRQHGMSDSAMQALLQPELLSEAREEAERLVESDPQLERHVDLAAAVARRLEAASIS
jgi:ATP-dependent DNA helicase RecG